MPYTSRIPTVMTLLEARLEAVAEKAADEVVAEAQRRAVADPEAWVTKALDQRAADPKAALPFPGYVPMHPGAGG